jgi:hypothetical protein
MADTEIAKRECAVGILGDDATKFSRQRHTLAEAERAAAVAGLLSG